MLPSPRLWMVISDDDGNPGVARLQGRKRSQEVSTFLIGYKQSSCIPFSCLWKHRLWDVYDDAHQERFRSLTAPSLRSKRPDSMDCNYLLACLNLMMHIKITAPRNKPTNKNPIPVFLWMTSVALISSISCQFFRFNSCNVSIETIVCCLMFSPSSGITKDGDFWWYSRALKVLLLMTTVQLLKYNMNVPERASYLTFRSSSLTLLILRFSRQCGYP